jgi:putative ABC transport system substrate-binding protein
VKRRAFLAGLLLASATRFALAQSPAKVHRIAMVHPARPASMMTEASGLPAYVAFFKELRQLGYVEGANLVVERYSAEGRTEHYAALARDVVLTHPELIFTISARMAQNFKAATTTTPIVAYTADPVAFGLARSLAQPGGNITGVTPDVGMDFWGKRLEILRVVVPTVRKVAFLTPREPWNGPPGIAVRKAADQVALQSFGALLEGSIDEAEYRRVFAAMAQERVDALIVEDAPENYANQRLITKLAENARLPTIYPDRSFVELGGLMAYGSELEELYRHLADQIDQVLKGAKPGEIPFYQASKYRLTINLSAAKTLGLAMPQSVLLRADEVIQ